MARKWVCKKYIRNKSGKTRCAFFGRPKGYRGKGARSMCGPRVLKKTCNKYRRRMGYIRRR